jgi:hypothetical protein
VVAGTRAEPAHRELVTAERERVLHEAGMGARIVDLAELGQPLDAP